MAAGVAPATPPATGAALRAWLDRGDHASMAWMAEHVDVRIDPRVLLEGARSVLCVADRYDGSPDDVPEGHGRIARYARGRDYHKIMKQRLHALCDRFAAAHPDHTFRACVDTAPVMERALAELAGIGRVGKNTMLIQQGTGSWVLLGEIVTTLAIEPTPAAQDDPCGTCTRCIDACPTDALTPWALDARRCISALTIEHREAIDASLQPQMGDWIFGCDICQEVCPHNQPTQRTRDAAVEPTSGTRAASLDLLDVLHWTNADRVEALAGTSATRAKLAMWRRNAVIALRNGPASDEVNAALQQVAADDSQPDMVRHAAAGD